MQHARKGNRARFKWNAREKIGERVRGKRKTEGEEEIERRSYRCAWRRPGSESGPLNQGKASGSRERMARLMSGVVATSADEDDEARYLRVNGECVHAPPPPLSYAFSLLPHLLLHLPPLKSDSFGTAARSSRHSFHFASTCHEEVAGRFFLSLSFRSRHASCWRSPAMWLRGNRARAWFDRYF